MKTFSEPGHSSVGCVGYILKYYDDRLRIKRVLNEPIRFEEIVICIIHVYRKIVAGPMTEFPVYFIIHALPICP